MLKEKKVIGLICKYCITVFLLFTLIPAELSSLVNFNKDQRKEYYNKAMLALANKDTLSAKKYLIESIKQFSDAPSLKELSKIYLSENTTDSRNKALEYLRLAVLKSPEDIEARYLYAEVLENHSKCAAFCEYKKITEMDITQSKAWIGMAKIKDEEFTEYNHSANLTEDEFSFSLQDYADENFYEAEKYYKQALVFEPLNYDAIFKLALLYDKAGKPEKGAAYLTRLVNEAKADKDIYLLLGLINYRMHKLKDAYQYYQKAIALMSYEERKDFTYNSVMFILNDKFKDLAQKLNQSQIKQLIQLYWKVNDPLYLTDYNERLLEHYSRVAFANLNFSVPKLGKVGWRTDRGEVVVRFGEPNNVIRFRPQMTGKSVLMKTEVWNYDNGLTFGFTDFASSNNYVFSIPAGDKDKFAPQFKGDSQYLIENARRIFPTYYNPVYEGPKFSAFYNIVQFKNSLNNKLTDVYLNYEFNISDSALANHKNYKHKVGIFVFDKYYNDVYRFNKEINFSPGDDSVIKVDSSNFFVNTIFTEMKPNTGTISFEIIRDADKSVSSNRDSVSIISFSDNYLDMSDVLLAYNVEVSNQSEKFINRKNVSILPNPSNKFSSKDKMFLYYELYNLKKDNNGLTNFNQEVTLTSYNLRNQSSFEKIINAALSFIGLKGKNQSIKLTSHYQTLEANPQIYFQVDMNKYPADDYLITITVIDNISKKKVSRETVLKWEG
ncbi:GWxTD domain-containing protein [Melioribacteraceae bacterium 4301-Me]|uniref:GWxTD domain-containing protein n=1 Tax=Pyranulibacter aquaticus TaxID=3163344 RepID=UPI0035999F8D